MAADGGADDAAPRTREEWFQDLAADALRNGQAALADGALDPACAWLERAQRMAPQDVTARLSLAVLRLRRGEAAPVPELLQDIAERAGLAELWLTLAAAHDRLGQAAAAAGAMARALSGHVLADAATLAPLADAVARAAGRPGWCGVDAEMRVVTGATAAAARLRVGDAPWRPRQKAPAADLLAVTVDGAHLLGSPIDLRRIRRLEGVVREEDGGLSGWAWLPGRPEVDPKLTVTDAAGRTLTLVAADEQALVSHAMARPRGFRLPASRLRGLSPPLAVTGPDGRHLPGSPLDPFGPARAAAAAARAAARLHPVACAGLPDLPAPGPDDSALALLGAPAACIGIPAEAASDPLRPVTVIVPVHDATAPALACLDSVLATLPPDATLLVVDDASRDPALVRALDALQAQGRIRLLRQPDNRGFAESANAGLAAAAQIAGHDMVLLNSDTLATPGWLERLRAAVHEAPDIGTATPFSNNATLLSHAGAASAADSRAAADALALLAARANAGVAVDIPTAVGFCMYIRRECLHATGLFRTAIFAQGYGEENDFCLRARHLGWRHVGVPGAFVAHRGGASFGAAGPGLLARNLDLLERLHPGYGALVAAFAASDPLAASRRRLDLARFRSALRGRAAAGAVILVTHDGGGGVERVVRARCAALATEGRAAVVLRPVRRLTGTPGYVKGLCVVGLGTASDFPDLRFAIPAELDALAALLRPLRPAALEVHHLMGHEHAVLRLAGMLGLQPDHHLHDYALFCPRVTLLGPSRSYCGEPLNPADCDSCVADAGRAIADDLPVAALWARSAADLAAARRVVVPSADAATRLRRHFPQAHPEIERLEDDSAWPDPDPPPQPPGGRRRVCVIGGIGPEKGYDVLLACARDAAARRLPLEFVLVGHTPDDRRLLDTGRAFVTGPYAEADATALVRAQGAQLAFLPSIWPETWCFALGVAWRSGLDAVAFDIGAQAERIRARGRGLVLPLGLPPAAINKALLAIEVTSGK